jgi:DNA polymerase/3'-5' exonuclease PolX
MLKKQITYDVDFLNKDKINNLFRLKAIDKVIKKLQQHDKKITSSEQLIGVKDIGKNSLARIDEILRTGKLSEIHIPHDIEKYLSFIDDLQEVYGIGKVTAYKMFRNHKITSISDLKKKYESGDIKLSPTLIKGLKYIDKIKENIPRQDINLLYTKIKKILLSMDSKIVCVICGSYRRKKDVSNDIDIVISHTDIIKKNDSDINYLDIFVKKLHSEKIIVEDLTEYGKTKYMGICNLNNILRRIDIRFIPYESFYTAILYFTGSKDLNTKMRQIAHVNGWILNEYGLFDENKKMIKITSEKEVFDLLNIKYLSPDERN